jgi:type I restriction enzyme S subunit
MSKDREAWAPTTVSHIAEEIFDGPFGSNLKSGDYVSEGARVVRLENIGHLRFFDEKRTYVTLEKYESLKKNSLHADDVLFSSFVDEEVRVCLFPRDPNVPTINKADCFCIRVNRAVCNPRWLAYTLACKPSYERLKEAVHGATRPRVNLSVLKSLRLDLPPLPEQRRIVAKVDTLSAKSKRARERLDHVRRLVEKYKQAVLAAAFNGDLTREWRRKSAMRRRWKETTIGEVLTDIRYGTAKKCRYDKGSVAVLRIPNVQQGRIALEDLKYADFDKNELSKLRLARCDLLVIRSNGSLDLVGRSAVVEEPAEGMLFAGYLIRLRIDPKLALPTFVHRLLQAPHMREVIERVAKSTSGVNNINSEELKSLPFSRPDLDEQLEIVHLVDQAFTWIDRLAADATSAHKLIDHLDQGILTKAFRGELVPQDPADEPASVLLDRIRSERTAGAEKVRKCGRRTTGGK